MVAILRLVRSFFASICLPISSSIGSAAGLWRGGLALAALLFVVGVAPVVAQSPVQFFGSFQSYSQDGASYAQGLVTDARGNLYVSGAHALVYIPVDANGNPTSNTNVSCSPGSGAVMGMAIDTTNHILYRADLTGPTGVTVPSVEEIALIGGSSTTCTLSVIDNGSWSAPSSVAVDASSNLYVLDAGIGSGTAGAIYKLTPGSGYAKNEVCSSTGLLNTTGLSIDGSGNFYVASSSVSAVAGFTYNYGMESPGSASTTGVFKVTGSGGGACTLTQIDSGLTSPTATAVDAAGNIWVADLGANEIYRLMPNGLGGYNQISFQSISQIRTLTVNSAGKVYGFGYQDAGLDKAVVWTGGTPPHNLGTYAVGTPAPTVTLTVDFMSAVIADGFNPTTQGAYARDFRAVGGTCTPASYSASQSCTVEVTFTPKAPGLRTGALVVTDESGNVLGTNYLYGTGTGPQAVFSPSAQVTLGGGFFSPMGVAVDGNGNAYVVDYTYPTVVTRVPAGCANAGCMTAVGGGFWYPEGVAVDGGGNVYVADYGYHAVKEIPAGCASSSCVTTLGGGFSGPLGVAVDGSGNVYVADGPGQVVKEMPAGCADASCVITLGGGFSDPDGVAVDGSGNVYVVDYGNQAVKEMPAGCASSNCVTTLDGGFNFPEGVAVDGSGNVYVGDEQAVKEMPAGCSSSSCVTTLASGFNPVRGVTVDSSGNVYVADGNDNEVKEVTRATPPSLNFSTPTPVNTIDTTDGPLSVTVANIGNATLSFLPDPFATEDFGQTAGSGSPVDCSDNGTVDAGASCNLSIQFAPVQNSLGQPTPLNEAIVLYDNSLNNSSAQQIIGVHGTSTAALAPVPDTTATAVAFNSASLTPGQTVNITVTVTDLTNSGTVPSGNVTFTDTVGSTTTSLNVGSPINLLSGVATLWIVRLSGTGTHTITATYSDGNGGATFLGSTATGLVLVNPTSAVGTPTSYPVTVTLPNGGSVSSISVLTQGATGLDFTDAVTGDTCLGSFNSGYTCTVNVIFTPAFAGPRYGAVVLEDGSGNTLATAFISGIGTAPQIAFGAGTPSATPIAPTVNSVPLSNPTGIAMDGAGDLFIADIQNSRVVEVPANGSRATGITPTAADPSGNVRALNNPAGLAVDGAGNLYIADVNNWRVLEVLANGGGVNEIIPTVNGTVLHNPTGVAVDGAGDLFISDTWNNRVVEISASGATTAIGPTVNTFTLNYPSGIAIDGAGDLFIADTLNNRVIEVPAGGGAATAITPTVNALPLNDPSGIAVDGAGDLFIADTLNSRVVEVPGDGSAAAAFAPTVNGAALLHPNGIVLDGAGNLYVADHGNSRVVELQRGTATVTLGSLAQTYTGSPLSVTATTNPDSLTVNFTYTGTGGTSYGPSFTAPTNTGSYTVVGTISDTNFTGTNSGTLVISQATATVALSGLAQTYTGSPLAAIVTTSPAGKTVTFTYTGISGTSYPTSSTPPTAAGSYTVVGTVSDTNYTGTNSGTLVISQATATVTLSSLAQTYTGSPLSATATTNPTGKTVTFTFTGISGTSYPTSSTPPTAAGTYTVVGTVSDTNYTGTNSGTLVISQATATVALSGLAETYTGSPIAATATTNPAGKTVTFTYTGISGTNYVTSSTPPTAAGSYSVVATISDTNYTGTNSGTLVISQATATVALSGLAETYTGSPIAATATTNPTGKTVTFTYTGTGGTTYGPSPTAPTAAGSYTVVGTVSDTNYTGTATGTLVISQATATVALSGLAETYTGSPIAATATTNPAGKTVTFTYTGISGTNYVTSSTPPTAAGSYSVVATISDTNYSGTATGTLIISQASSPVNLTSSVNPVLTTNPTTLTAIVSATQGTPTGSVSFLDGSTLIGQGTLAGGVATLTTSSLAVGSHSITAIYSGDTNFVAATSGALAESVLDFAVSIPTSGSGNGASQTVAPGGTATYTLDIAPTSGTSIPTAAALTLTGLPAGATATVTPSTWTQLTGSSWSLAANTVLAPVVLSIQLPSQTARLEHNDLSKGKLPYALLGLLLLPFAGRLRRTGKQLGGTLSILILLVAGVTVMAGLSGCGSAGSKSSQQPQSYTITETITSGALSHSTTITLDVN